MKKTFQLCVVLAALSLLQACGFEIVDTGHRGVKTTFGDVVSESLPEGIYFYNPFTSNINELDVRTLSWTSESSTYTKDVQTADIKFTLNYSLEPSYAHTMFKQVGEDWAQKLLPQRVEGALKDVIGKWDAENLIGNRDKAQIEAFNLIKSSLASVHVIASGFEFNNIDYSDAFEKSVENKVVAIQKAIEEKNRTVQIQEQAKQTIVSAEASAKAIQIRAEALKANANLVEYEAVQKWDGKLPQYSLGGATPFINLGGK